MNTTYDSREYSKLIVFYHYFRDDLTEFTQGLLFSSFQPRDLCMFSHVISASTVTWSVYDQLRDQLMNSS